VQDWQSLIKVKEDYLERGERGGGAEEDEDEIDLQPFNMKISF